LCEPCLMGSKVPGTVVTDPPTAKPDAEQWSRCRQRGFRGRLRKCYSIQSRIQPFFPPATHEGYSRSALFRCLGNGKDQQSDRRRLSFLLRSTICDEAEMLGLDSPAKCRDRIKVMQELLRHSSLRSTLDVYTQAISPAKHAAQAAVLNLVFAAETNCSVPE
jgi:hypothetical protein